MKFTVIIPARYESTRFPGKPLAKICGKEMIIRVCEQVSKTGIPLAVATDDKRIYDCVVAHGYKAVITRRDHPSGTDRVREACGLLEDRPDVVINVQGDEPFIDPLQIETIKSLFEDHEDTDIATLVRKFDKGEGFEALFDANLVKVVRDDEGNALYFSRSIVPYVRKYEWKEWLDQAEFFTHLGIYGYKSDVLDAVTKLPVSSLEKAESLEQLRWLQNGYRIRTAVTDKRGVGIDTPEDLAKAEKSLAQESE